MNQQPRYAAMPLPAKALTTTLLGGVISPDLPPTATPLERCDAEIATAISALTSGSIPEEQALLYCADWYVEHSLILSTPPPSPTAIQPPHTPAVPPRTHRASAHAATLSLHEGFQARQRAREAKRLPIKLYMLDYAAAARAVERALRPTPPTDHAIHRSSPQYIVPKFPLRPVPTITQSRLSH